MLTVHGADALLDGGTLPATLYAQLHTGDPGPTGVANVSALVDGRYAVTFADAVSGVASNDAAVNLDDTGGGLEETLTHISLHDAETGGNCWITDALLAPVEAATGVPLRFPIGNLRIRMA